MYEINAAVVPPLTAHLESANLKFSDVSIVVGSEVFQGHRVILARVPFFEAAFRTDCVGCLLATRFFLICH